MSVLVFTEIYGLPVEAAAGLAVFIWIITFVVIVPVGFVCAFHEGLNWSKLRRLPQGRFPMTCPFCGFKQDRVIDSRESKEGDVIRRRRQCLGCERRFTTYERSDEIPYMVVKEGRPAREVRPPEGPERAAQRPAKSARSPWPSWPRWSTPWRARLADNPDREITTTEIGEMLMDTTQEASTRSPMCALLRSTGTSRTSRLFLMN